MGEGGGKRGDGLFKIFTKSEVGEEGRKEKGRVKFLPEVNKSDRRREVGERLVEFIVEV